uniref:Uncharacterized protein n=1 Tax=Strigamia maritima TaxID=126957 RepID=T1IRG3_STRMM
MQTRLKQNGQNFSIIELCEALKEKRVNWRTRCGDLEKQVQCLLTQISTSNALDDRAESTPQSLTNNKFANTFHILRILPLNEDVTASREDIVQCFIVGIRFLEDALENLYWPNALLKTCGQILSKAYSSAVDFELGEIEEHFARFVTRTLRKFSTYKDINQEHVYSDQVRLDLLRVSDLYRKWRFEVGSWKQLQVGSWKQLQVGSWKQLQVGSWKQLQVGSCKQLQVGSWKQLQVGSWKQLQVGSWKQLQVGSWKQLQVGSWKQLQVGSCKQLQKQLQVEVGSNCRLEVGSNCRLEVGSNCRLEVGSNCRLEVGSNCRLEVGSNCRLEVGSNCRLEVESNCRLEVGSNYRLEVGSNCRLEVVSNCRLQ